MQHDIVADRAMPIAGLRDVLTRQIAEKLASQFGDSYADCLAFLFWRRQHYLHLEVQLDVCGQHPRVRIQSGRDCLS